MKFLGIGDVIGEPGCRAVAKFVPALRAEYGIDVVIANAENSANGVGTTVESAKALFSGGVDIITGGNHTWRHREYLQLLAADPRCLRPENYPKGTEGRGIGLFTLDDGRPYAVVNLIGRTFMDAVENPFRTIDDAWPTVAAHSKIVIVDMHAEASSEKRAMGMHLDGRASCIWGTHTHIPTADEEILPRGSGYVTDLGLTGPYHSVIGMEVEPAVKRFVTNRPAGYKVASGNVQLRALLVDIDDATGRCRSIERIVQKLS